MEQRTEEFYKKITNEETGETMEVLDYTMRYTYDVTTVMVDVQQEDGTTIQELQEIETLIKTERLDDYGTWLIEAQPGYISVRNVKPTQKYIDEHSEEFAPRTETQEEKIARLEAELKLTQAALDELILNGGAE